jgi:hypothetical protein
LETIVRVQWHLGHIIIKIDTEGHEAYILDHLPFTPGLLLVEWHSDALRWCVESSTICRSMQLVASTVLGQGYGLLKYASGVRPSPVAATTTMKTPGVRPSPVAAT